MPRRQTGTKAEEWGHASGGRKAAERLKVLRLLEPYLELIRNSASDDSQVHTIESVAAAIGKSKTTLYNHGLDGVVKKVLEERAAAVGRVRRARPGARQKMAALTAERDRWQRRYEELLDHHTRLVDALRLHPSIDVTRILATPMTKVDRSQPHSGSRQRRHIRMMD